MHTVWHIILGHCTVSMSSTPWDTVSDSTAVRSTVRYSMQYSMVCGTVPYTLLLEPDMKFEDPAS